MEQNQTEADEAYPEWWRPEKLTETASGFDLDAVEHPLLDADDSAADAQLRLQGAVLAARYRRFLSTTLRPGPLSMGHMLLGTCCVENTAVLLDELDRRGIEARPVTGSNRDDITEMFSVDARGIAEAIRRGVVPHEDIDEQYPTTADTAMKHGCQHHWVEAKVDGVWWVVDAAQYRFDYGDSVPYVGLTTPAPYQRYSDSYEYAADYFDRVRGRLDIGAVGPSLHDPDPNPDSWIQRGR